MARNRCCLIILLCSALLVACLGSVSAEPNSNETLSVLVENSSVAVTPSLNITEITDSSVSGVVENVTPEEYNVVVYVNNGGLWWGPKPTFAEPLTKISSDLTWKSEYNTDPNDATVSTVAAYLISRNVTPPEFKNGVKEISAKTFEFVAFDTIKR